MERFLHPAGSSRGRLDSIRHLFYFFLFLFFNLVAGERSGLVIDVAVSKPETGNRSRCHGSPKAIFLSPSSRLICVQACVQACARRCTWSSKHLCVCVCAYAFACALQTCSVCACVASSACIVWACLGVFCPTLRLLGDPHIVCNV